MSSNEDIKKMIEELKNGSKVKDSKSVVVGSSLEAVVKEPSPSSKKEVPVKEKKAIKKKADDGQGIAGKIAAYDNSDSQHLLHIRVNEKTYNLVNALAMATKLNATKIIGFATADLFSNNPELEQLIKQHMQNLKL